ncbi:MAG TPA: GreA/GreB family elongation factor, partial [Myxococcota bacterium]
ADLENDLETMVAAARATHEAATHPEAKPENDKDTRGIELGYLAVGQSARAAEQQRALNVLRTLTPRAFTAADLVDVTALVTLRDDDTDAVSHSLLAPLGGGQRLQIGGQPVQIVSPAAPLGAAVLGKKVGDVVEVVIAGKTRTFVVETIQ